jgi:hypothetical protein
MPAPKTVAEQARSRRPRSLKEVALWGRELGDVDAFLRGFLDEFHVERDPLVRAAMLAEEPALEPNERANAYFGAAAEHLALRNKLAVPEWTGRPERFLKRPFFPCGLESLKAHLLVHSPTAFRRRLIFVDADPLYRPRRDRVGIVEGQGPGVS